MLSSSNFTIHTLIWVKIQGNVQIFKPGVALLIYNHKRLRESKSKLLRSLRSFIDLFWQMKNSKHNIENFLMFRKYKKSLYMKLVSLSTSNLIRFFPDSPNQISFLGRVLKRNITSVTGMNIFALKPFFCNLIMT